MSTIGMITKFIDDDLTDTKGQESINVRKVTSLNQEIKYKSLV